MDYRQTLELLYNLLPDFQNVGSEAYKPGLERMRQFNRILGHPDRNFCSIHIAGTNGKGSVSHILASVLETAGYRVGLFTSPHLHDFRERIRIDGQMIPESYVMDFTSRYLETLGKLGLSFFEATTAMAFDYFSEMDVEVAVVEAGLGGRLDSTNIINPVLSIVTNIGYDHQAYLGETLEKIAGEKAGIIKHGVPVVIGESQKATDEVFRNKAAEEKTAIHFAQSLFETIGAERTGENQTFTLKRARCGTEFDLTTDLCGVYQQKNVITALGAIEVINRETQLNVSNRAIKAGISSVGVSTGLRGRWETIAHSPRVIVDTGHNAHGINLVVDQLRSEKYGRLFFILGVVNDKDISAILPLLPSEAEYFFTRPSVARGLPAEILAQEAAKAGLRGTVIPDVREALEKARTLATDEDLIFVGGSNFTVADALS